MGNILSSLSVKSLSLNWENYPKFLNILRDIYQILHNFIPRRLRWPLGKVVTSLFEVCDAMSLKIVSKYLDICVIRVVCKKMPDYCLNIHYIISHLSHWKTNPTIYVSTYWICRDIYRLSLTLRFCQAAECAMCQQSKGPQLFNYCSCATFKRRTVCTHVTKMKDFFYVLLTVHISIIFVINQFNAQILVL